MRSYQRCWSHVDLPNTRRARGFIHTPEEEKAIKAYTQSLYIIYFIQSEIEPSAVYRFIESFSQLSEISSDSILNFTTSQNFNNIYRRVRNKWMAAELLPNN